MIHTKYTRPAQGHVLCQPLHSYEQGPGGEDLDEIKSRIRPFFFLDEQRALQWRRPGEIQISEMWTCLDTPSSSDQ